MITTVLAFILTLGVLIVVHEYGHYRVAVACGVKVLRFSVGFGRVIWRRQTNADATEFTLCALPLGGYVKMLDEREGPVTPEQQHLAFNRKSLTRRSAIVAAGPLANLLLAVLLYAASQWIGTTQPAAVLSMPLAGSVAAEAGLRPADKVRSFAVGEGDWHEVRSLDDLRWAITEAVLNAKVLRLEVNGDEGRGGLRTLQMPLDRLGGASAFDDAMWRRIGVGAPYSEPVLGVVSPGGPADKAGLKQGDLVLSLQGHALPDAQALFEQIRSSPLGQPMQWQIQRNGQARSFTVVPRVIEQSGRKLNRIDAYIGGPPATVLVRLGPWAGLARGIERTWDNAALSLKMMGRMLIGQASLSNLSGPLTIADVAGQSVQLGLTQYLDFLAVVSVGLGVLNLLPLPLLDGGHLLYYLFEGLTGRPVSELWLAWLQRAGASMLLLLMSVALYNDVARLLGLQ
jgi:regulator of sigma E protease